MESPHSILQFLEFYIFIHYFIWRLLISGVNFIINDLIMAQGNIRSIMISVNFFLTSLVIIPFLANMYPIITMMNISSCKDIIFKLPLSLQQLLEQYTIQVYKSIIFYYIDNYLLDDIKKNTCYLNMCLFFVYIKGRFSFTPL